MAVIKSQERFDEPVSQQVLDRALERGAQRKNGLQATTVRYLADLQSLLIGFTDSSAVVLPIKNYPELEALVAADLDEFEIALGGSTLCLAEKDLHLSIAGLVLASEPLMEMATTLVAARNGSRISTAKSRAARENGAKGGRPRKLAQRPRSGDI